jgi:hypothetical protein
MPISDQQYQDWLRSDTAARVMLVEASYYDSGLHTVYISNSAYVSRPTDTPSNQPYDDAVLSIPQFSSSLSDALSGFTVPSWGDIVISNEDYSRDSWLDYSWDGRPVSILFGDASWPRSDFRYILTGVIAAPPTVPSAASIALPIRDKQWALNVPIQTKLVGEPVLTADAGGKTYKVSDSAVTSIDKVWDNGTLLSAPAQYTTSPATGKFTLVAAAVGRVTCEFTGGNATKGTVVPLAFGPCFNISPVSINTSLLKYQVHDGQIEDITDVRDNGVSVGFTKDLLAGTFTLSVSAVGEITADVLGAKPGGVYLATCGDQVNHIVTTRSSLASSDVNSTSLAAFVALCPQPIGLYVRDRRNVLDCLDELVNSVGSWYTFDRSGKMIFGRMDVPSGSPVLELTADDVVFGTLKVTKCSLPWATARIGYKPNYTQQSQVAGSVTTANRLLYSLPMQYASRNKQSVKTAHLLALEPDAKATLLASATDTGAECDRLLTLWGDVRCTYSAECITSPLTLNVGSEIKLTHPRYGMSAGMPLIVVGIAESITTRRVTLTMWG